MRKSVVIQRVLRSTFHQRFVSFLLPFILCFHSARMEIMKDTSTPAPLFFVLRHLR